MKATNLWWKNIKKKTMRHTVYVKYPLLLLTVIEWVCVYVRIQDTRKHFCLSHIKCSIQVLWLFILDSKNIYTLSVKYINTMNIFRYIDLSSIPTMYRYFSSEISKQLVGDINYFLLFYDTNNRTMPLFIRSDIVDRHIIYL